MDNVRRAQKPRPQVAKKNFPKPLDKPHSLWYNKSVVEGNEDTPQQKGLLYYGKAQNLDAGH